MPPNDLYNLVHKSVPTLLHAIDYPQHLLIVWKSRLLPVA